MTTHVSIVNLQTFKVHLEYLFAGTGAGKNSYIDFNGSEDTKLHHSTERNLVGMIADASRIRRGDFIIFYLQQESIYEGKFYGIFKAKENHSFIDNDDETQYLRDKLEKSLTFRTFIEPYKVYPRGVSEWEALDEIKNIQSPNQMLWSLIYRKLKGNRGNTMITIYEQERLLQLIRNKNNRRTIEPENNLLSFDAVKQKIVCLNQERRLYKGTKEDINILPRLIKKYQKKKAFEIHLQTYIVGNIGLDKELNNAILERGSIEWIGNEVSCGVGMQRIDIMLSIIKNEQRIIVPIELKDEEAHKSDVLNQLQRYIDWVEQYYIPNRQSDIQPVLITKIINNKDTEEYPKFIEDLDSFNEKNKNRTKKLKYIEFNVQKNRIIFNKIDY